MKKLRFGILSAAGIARKNWKAIYHSGNSIVTAVASRDVARSREFIEKCQAAQAFENVPIALGSYEELLASKNVDAIYIPLPTGLRKEWVIRAARAGKHVVCEKPCAINADDLREMIEACRQHRVQFMDGVMFMHSPRMARVREALDDGASIGPVRRIMSSFTFYVGEEFFRTNIRANGSLEPTGCIGDLGWYCIRFSLWAMHWQMPRAVAGRILSQSENLPGRPSAPTEFSGELIFADGVSAGFHCSFHAVNQQWVNVSGMKGHLRFPDFVHPHNTHEPSFEVNHTQIKVAAAAGELPRPAGSEANEMGHPTAQDTRMFRNFANQISTGKLNEEWPEWSLKTQQVMDACFESARRGSDVTM